MEIKEKSWISMSTGFDSPVFALIWLTDNFCESTVKGKKQIKSRSGKVFIQDFILLFGITLIFTFLRDKSTNQ